METSHWVESLRAGWAGVAAGPLLILSSGIELMVHVQEPDGTVVAPVPFTALVALWALGMSCVGVTVREIAARHATAGRPLSRAGRIGVRSAIVGCGLHVAFAAGAAITAALSGKPLEAVFLLFALGFLALIVGAVMLGTAVWLTGVLGAARVPLWFGAASALAAIVVPLDPWHDVALFAFDASWAGLGAVLLRDSRRRVAQLTAVRAAA
jgi:hypothetical protein